MKAVICTKYGPPEVLKVREITKPVPKDGEILVRIIASAVNSADVRVRGLLVGGLMKPILRLALGFSKPRKPILGTVYSGIIESTGIKVSKYKTGDKVFGMTGFDFGAYAEYIVIKESRNVSLMPQNATFDEAAALIFGGQTAIYFLDKLKLAQKHKPKVLIIGASGSVGSAAVQIAKYYGADITAVVSSGGLHVIKELGGSKVILYDQGELEQTTAKFDLIFDASGKASKNLCKKLLVKGGIYKTVGGLDFASETLQQLQLIKDLWENGAYSALIDKTFPLDQIVEAHRYVESGRKKGNVVLKIIDPQLIVKACKKKEIGVNSP
jgi:NADPH:quinone reductase-like Zn-dependent oxidoreductase